MTIDLTYELAGEVREYKNIWEKIEDEHFPECPTSVSAARQVKSTLCLCLQLEDANRDARECCRCHNLASDCGCGAKAQLV